MVRSRHRVEIVHESLLRAWPRLVRWQTQDADGALLRDQLRQAARAWEERGRRSDLLWTGAAVDEYRVWRGRYPGGLTAIEETFADAMLAQAERRRRRLRAAGASALVAAVVVAIVTGTLWRRSEAARQQAVVAEETARAEARRAEAGKLLALGQARVAAAPSEALAYALASLELHDAAEARTFISKALAQGPPMRVASTPGSRTYLRLAFSGDGRWLAATSAPAERILLWSDDGAAAAPLGPLDVGGPQATVAFTEGDRYLYARSGNKIWVWSFPERELIRTATLPPKTATRLRGERLFTASTVGRDEVVRRGRVDSDEVELVGRVGAFQDWDIDAVGSWFAYAQSRTINVRSLADWSAAPRVVGRHAAPIHCFGCLAFAPSGDRLAALDSSGAVVVWEWSGAPGPASGRRLVRDSTEGAGLLAFDATGTRLTLGGTAERLLWDLTGPPDARPLSLGVGVGGQAVFDPSGEWLVSADVSQIVFWPARQRAHVLPSRGKYPSLAFSPYGRFLASGSTSGSVWLIPLAAADGASRVVFEGRPGGGIRVVFSPDGRRLLVTEQRGGGVHVVPLDGGKPRRLSGFERGALMSAGAFGSGGVVAAAPKHDPAGVLIRLWDLETGAVRVLDPEAPAVAGGGIGRLGFAPDGRLITLGGRGLRRWDVEQGTAELLWAPRAADRFLTMALSVDGRLALTYSAPFDARSTSEPLLHNLGAGTHRPFTAHGRGVRAAAFDPSGTVLATGDTEGVVRVGAVSGGEPHLLLGHVDQIGAVAVSPDRKWVAAVVADGTIRLWRLPDVSVPPLHALPYEELLAKVRTLTNLRVVEDEDASGGYRVEPGPFPGWMDVPTW